MDKKRDSAPGRKATSPRKCVLTLDVDTEGPEWTSLGETSPAITAQKVASALPDFVDLPANKATATVLLSNDAHVQALNRQWRGLDKPTNVLSFPAAPPPAQARRAALHLGDIVLAEETVAREADAMQISRNDHFTHLVLHGMLHLLGHDHETDDEAEAMEAIETRILATFGIADPYGDSEPLGAGADHTISVTGA
jgi:probable rRNA maturation factor